MRKAYITGADHGLGLALVEAFLRNGDFVFAGFYGLDRSGLDSLKLRYQERLEIVPLDVSRDVSVWSAAALITAKTKDLDVLINNAAILGKKENKPYMATVDDSLDFEDMLTTYNVNALGPLRVTQSVLPLLRAGREKRILNISSEAGSMNARIRKKHRNRYGYCGSKAALNIQSILLNNHLSEEGIHLTLIEPGWLRTYMAGDTKSTNAPTEPEESAEKLLAFLNRPAPDYLFHDLFLDQPFDW